MKKVLLIGATGLLGRAIIAKLGNSVELIEASRNHGEYSVELSDPQSLKALFEKVGPVDAIICTAGVAYFQALPETTDADWQFALANKLMGQINVIRLGHTYVKAGGTIVLTTGTLAQTPLPGSAMVSAVNAAVEAAIRAFSLELEQVRINAVSPGWISETLAAMGMDTAPGLPAAEVAEHYLALLNGAQSAEIRVASKG